MLLGHSELIVSQEKVLAGYRSWQCRIKSEFSMADKPFKALVRGDIPWQEAVTEEDPSEKGLIGG